MAIVDLFSRHVLSWKLSNSLDTEFCLDALEMALEGGHKPQIFHSGQGCQFTSTDFVARLQAVDTFLFALGSELAEFPVASEDCPTGEVASDAEVNRGWVPTVGPAPPPSALSAVPAEHRAMLDLHGVFYLSIPDMADLDAQRGLHRTQMELVAARTSLLNECFF